MSKSILLLIVATLALSPFTVLETSAFSGMQSYGSSCTSITPQLGTRIGGNSIISTTRRSTNIHRSRGGGRVALVGQSPRRSYSVRLTTKKVVGYGASNDNYEDDFSKIGIFQKAKRKFQARPGTYLIIPVIAAIVGWFTNYLAVQMIFYPINYWGISLWRRPEVPLGFIGWQGIVPCKTKTMSIALVNMVTSQLLTVSEAFARLDPKTMAAMLAPEIPQLGAEVIGDIAPNALSSIPFKIWHKLSSSSSSWGVVKGINSKVLVSLIKDMQQNIEAIFSLESCVVLQMVQDRAKLGELFREVGQKELDFLTNSGLWFGFLLGLIQMAVALVWENPWSLSIGGGIVGLATNWLALKWIFEPVNPTKIGPFILQGQFLRRQREVSALFSKFFADKILTSPSLWNSMFTNPDTVPAFHSLVAGHLKKFCNIISLGLFRGIPSKEAVDLVASKTLENLPKHVHVLHGYIDKTLGLEKTLRTKMELMTPIKFERVLHPIFEEDELTLIIAGAVLGFAAGLVQQGLETGAIKLKSPLPIIRRFLQRIKNLIGGKE